VVAIAVAAALQILLFTMRGVAQGDVRLWPLMYLPVLFAATYVAALLLRLSRARRAPALPA
jgi:hypothetical protein